MGFKGKISKGGYCVGNTQFFIIVGRIGYFLVIPNFALLQKNYMLLFGFIIRFCIFALMAKGRDKELIELRDKKLFERYYYWSEVQRLRFDDTIRKLAFDEFFLSEATTLRIIKRMLTEGATIDGKTIKNSRYQGFRPSRRTKSKTSELSFFAE